MTAKLEKLFKSIGLGTLMADFKNFSNFAIYTTIWQAEGICTLLYLEQCFSYLKNAYTTDYGQSYTNWEYSIAFCLRKVALKQFRFAFKATGLNAGGLTPYANISSVLTPPPHTDITRLKLYSISTRGKAVLYTNINK
jgi:hypothetical protein